MHCGRPTTSAGRSADGRSGCDVRSGQGRPECWMSLMDRPAKAQAASRGRKRARIHRRLRQARRKVLFRKRRPFLPLVLGAGMARKHTRRSLAAGFGLKKNEQPVARRWLFPQNVYGRRETLGGGLCAAGRSTTRPRTCAPRTGTTTSPRPERQPRVPLRACPAPTCRSWDKRHAASAGTAGQPAAPHSGPPVPVARRPSGRASGAETSIWTPWITTSNAN